MVLEFAALRSLVDLEYAALRSFVVLEFAALGGFVVLQFAGLRSFVALEFCSAQEFRRLGVCRAQGFVVLESAARGVSSSWSAGGCHIQPPHSNHSNPYQAQASRCGPGRGPTSYH